MAVLITADGNITNVPLSPEATMDELIGLVGGLPYVAYEHKIPYSTVFIAADQDGPLNKRATQLLQSPVYGSVLLVSDDFGFGPLEWEPVASAS
jgi:hypothetical protein